MNVADLSGWMDFLLKVGGVAGLGNALLYVVLRGRFQTKEEGGAGLSRLAAAEGKLLVIEAEIKLMPTREDIHQLSLLVTQLRGAVDRVEAIQERLEEQVKTHGGILTDPRRG